MAATETESGQPVAANANDDDELFREVQAVLDESLLCAICQQVMDPKGHDGGQLAACRCGHVFHESCLESVYQHGRPRGWCPVCRADPGSDDGRAEEEIVIDPDASQVGEQPAAEAPDASEIVL